MSTLTEVPTQASTQMKTRTESDCMGKIEVPAQCLLGSADAALASAF